jgi:hypothetical protein
LKEVAGVGDVTITQPKLIAAAASHIAKGQMQQRTLLSSWNDVLDYCRTSMVAFAEGARHFSETQRSDRRDRHRYRQELVPHVGHDHRGSIVLRQKWSAAKWKRGSPTCRRA